VGKRLVEPHQKNHAKTRAPSAASLTAKALSSLRALASMGAPGAAAAIQALALPEDLIDSASLALSKLSSGGCPDHILWDQAMHFIAELSPEQADLWQCEALRASLNLPSSWNGQDYFRMLDDEDECDEEPFYILADLLARCLDFAPLGPKSHRLLHLLARESDLLLGASLSLHGSVEADFVQALFSAPRGIPPEQARPALFMMWQTHALISEQGTFSDSARPRATLSLFRSHSALGARLSDCSQGVYPEPFEALMAEGCEPEEAGFDECLSMLRSEGWRLSPHAFLSLCCCLPTAHDSLVAKRSRAIARLAVSDPSLLRCSLRGLPLAYHLNTARSRLEHSDSQRQAAALDELFILLCQAGMNPDDVWPSISPLAAASSPAIRALVEHKALGLCALPPLPEPSEKEKRRGAL
jgi:hypothetical protein